MKKSRTACWHDDMKSLSLTGRLSRWPPVSVDESPDEEPPMMPPLEAPLGVMAEVLPAATEDRRIVLRERGRCRVRVPAVSYGCCLRGRASSI